MKYILIFIAGVVCVPAVLFGWTYYAENYRDAEIYQSLGEGLSEDLLRDAVFSVEQYNLIFKHYPASIDELRGGAIHPDPALPDDCGCYSDFYYQKIDEHEYYLFSRGRDCLAFTSDDIHPVLSDEQRSSIGLRIAKNEAINQENQVCGGN